MERQRTRRTYTVLQTFDDAQDVIVGLDDGRIACLTVDELGRWAAARRASTRMAVEYVALAGEVPPVPVLVDDDPITLDEYTFAGTPYRIVAGYSGKTRTWVVGQ